VNFLIILKLTTPMSEVKSMLKVIVKAPNLVTNATYCSLDGDERYVYHFAANGGS
jgi:hypothetical protein